jgi:hypothetical protein
MNLFIALHSSQPVNEISASEVGLDGGLSILDRNFLFCSP